MVNWIKRTFEGRAVFQNDELKTKSAEVSKSTWLELPPGITKENWRDHLIRMTSPIEVGGFRPTEKLTASVFGDVRVSLKHEEWPSFQDMPLWPLCQFNLDDSPLLPNELSDIKLISIFVHPEIISEVQDIIDTSDTRTPKPLVIRVYREVLDLVEIARPQMDIPLRPFEVKWLEPVPDYPNHDCLPFNFNLLGIGDYYDQPDIENVQATKFGGYPGTVQSEPWWRHKSNDHDFEFVLQIESEPKSNWGWGDGAAYLARSRKDPHLWALFT